MSKKLLIILIAAAAVIAIAIVIAVIVKAKRKNKAEKEEKPDKRSQPKKSEKTDESDLQADVFSEYAELFEGLYESIYISEKNTDDTEAYVEFCERIEKSEKEKLKETFEDYFVKSDVEDEKLYQSKLESLLKLFDKAGIKRLGDTGKTVTYDEKMKDIFIIGSGKPVSGQKYTIIKPAWVKDGKAVENGMMIPSE